MISMQWRIRAIAGASHLVSRSCLLYSHLDPPAARLSSPPSSCPQSASLAAWTQPLALLISLLLPQARGSLLLGRPPLCASWGRWVWKPNVGQNFLAAGATPVCLPIRHLSIGLLRTTAICSISLHLATLSSLCSESASSFTRNQVLFIRECCVFPSSEIVAVNRYSLFGI
jgi:hypothetical protein